MSLFRTAVLIGLAAMAAAVGFRFWLERGEEAGLRADLEAARVLALDYARHLCGSTPPASPESMSQAARRLGRPAPGVIDPDRWSIRLQPRPGGAGNGVRLRYRAARDELANSVFAVLPGAARASGHIEIPVFRNPAGNRSGFRWLMSDEGC